MPRRSHTHVFFAHNGPGPYPCCFCGEPVDFWTAVVHHLDEDRSNNDPSNLEAAHSSCHTTYHNRKRWAELTPEERTERLAVTCSAAATAAAKRREDVLVESSS